MHTSILSGARVFLRGLSRGGGNSTATVGGKGGPFRLAAPVVALIDTEASVAGAASSKSSSGLASEVLANDDLPTRDRGAGVVAVDTTTGTMAAVEGVVDDGRRAGCDKPSIARNAGGGGKAAGAVNVDSPVCSIVEACIKPIEGGKVRLVA